MSRRTLPTDPSIGQRVRARRELKRWTVRHAASVAGISHTTWSRIEHGQLRADRYLAADIAAALECSVSELTGQPFTPSDRLLETAHARVERVWLALVESAPDEPPYRPVVPVEQLAEQMALLDDRRRACDYAGAGLLLPDLLADLHAATRGPDARAVLLLAVQATYAATFTLRNLGYARECALAAERCRQAAELLDEPVPLAVADWVRSHAAVAAGSFRRSLTLTGRAADDLERHAGEPDALAVLGMCRLTSALAAMSEHADGGRRTDVAYAHLAEAERIAEITGETRAWHMSFGPTNAAIWRIGIEVDAGDAGQAVATAARVNPMSIPSKARQASYYVDRGRALSDVGRDRDAVRSLLAAERIAPQRVRSSTSAREAARFLLARARQAAGGPELRGLAERLGVAA